MQDYASTDATLCQGKAVVSNCSSVEKALEAVPTSTYLSKVILPPNVTVALRDVLLPSSLMQVRFGSLVAWPQRWPPASCASCCQLLVGECCRGAVPQIRVLLVCVLVCCLRSRRSVLVNSVLW
jgi:hypothetical protein